MLPVPTTRPSVAINPPPSEVLDMAVFVDLDDEPQSPNSSHLPPSNHGALQSTWSGSLVKSLDNVTLLSDAAGSQDRGAKQTSAPVVLENLNRNGMTEALGAYP
jgi:hypothetical protein